MSQNQLDAVHAFIRAVNESDITSIASMLSDDATLRYMPVTMGPEAAKVHDRVGMIAVFEGTFDNVVQYIQIEIKELVQGNDQIVILIDENGKRKDGTPYFVQYVMFIRFTPDTDSISSITEFQDSLFVSTHFAGWYNKACWGRHRGIVRCMASTGFTVYPICVRAF